MHFNFSLNDSLMKKKHVSKKLKRVLSELQDFETEILCQQFPSSQNVPSFHMAGQVFSILF